MDTLAEQVQEKIQEAFWDKLKMDFVDEKWDGKHFYLEIISEKFEWLGRIQRSQLVYSTLDDFMRTWAIHALRMKTKTPNEL